MRFILKDKYFLHNASALMVEYTATHKEEKYTIICELYGLTAMCPALKVKEIILPSPITHRTLCKDAVRGRFNQLINP